MSNNFGTSMRGDSDADQSNVAALQDSPVTHIELDYGSFKKNCWQDTFAFSAPKPYYCGMKYGTSVQAALDLAILRRLLIQNILPE
jgi:hypothetical protein